MRKFLSTFIALTFVYSPKVLLAHSGVENEVKRQAHKVAEQRRADKQLERAIDKYCPVLKKQFKQEISKKKNFFRRDFNRDKSIEENLKHAKNSDDFVETLLEFSRVDGIASMFDKIISDNKYLDTKDFDQDCKDLVTKKLTDVLREENKNKRHNYHQVFGHVESLKSLPGGVVGICSASLVKAGVVVSNVKSSCNEMEGLVDKENSTTMTVMNHLLTAAEANKENMYGIVGDDHYCGKCLRDAFTATSGKSQEDFQNKKNEYEKLLINELGTEKVMAGLYQFSDYLEKLEKMNNLHGGKLIDNGDPTQDFYCIEELNTLLQNQTAGCNQGKERFVAALKNMGVCKNEDCQSLTGEEFFKKFQENISRRDTESPAACYTIENSQLRSTESVAKLSNLFGVLKDQKYKDFILENFKGKLPPEYKNKKPYEKMSYIINEMSKKPEEFPELAKIYNIITKGFFETQVSSVDSEKRINNFFQNVFQDLPELELVFSQNETFSKELSKYKKSENQNQSFIEYVNSNLFNNDYKSSIERLKPLKDKSCKGLAETLKSGMCLDDKGGLSQFSPADIAFTSKKLVDRIEGADNIIPASDKLALASLSCEIRNKLTSTQVTVGNPVEYLVNNGDIPSNFAISKSFPLVLRNDDFVKLNGDLCKKSNGPVSELKNRVLKLLPNLSLGDAIANDQAMQDEINQTVEHFDEIVAESASHDYDKGITENLSGTSYGYGCTNGFCGNTRAGSFGTLLGGRQDLDFPAFDIKPAGVILSEPTVPTELPEIVITPPPSISSPVPDNSSTSVTSTTNLETTNTLDNNNSFSNESSVNLNPFESLMTSQSTTNAALPNYNSYSMSNYSQPQKKLSVAEEESRKETIKGIYQDFPDTFSSEQLEGLSNDQLKELLSFAKEKNSEDKKELEAEKAKFEEEKAKFEKEKIQAEIAELEKEKKKLLEENKVIARSPASSEVENHSILKSSSTKKDLTPKVDADKTVINNISQSADNYNRQAEVPSQVSHHENFNSGVANTATTGIAGAMNSSTTGAAIATLREYGSSYSSGGSNTVEQVDSYLNYVQDNHVSTSELVKRGPAGEVVELIIPNNKGELVSLDMASLSAEERKKLEDKIEKLIALEGQESGIKIGSGAKVKAGSGVLFNQVKDIDEKIFELQNQYQETYLSDLKQQLLDAIIVKK